MRIRREGRMLYKTVLLMILLLVISSFHDAVFSETSKLESLYNKPGNTFIAGAGGRIIEVTPGKQIVWEYELPRKLKPYSIGGGRASLNCAVRLKNGNNLITLGGRGTVIEVNRQKEIIWKYPEKGIIPVRTAFETAEGNFLITVETVDPRTAGYIKGPSRIIVINRKKEILWQYNFSENEYPYWAVPLENGEILFGFDDSKKRKSEVVLIGYDKIIKWRENNQYSENQSANALLELDKNGQFILPSGKIKNWPGDRIEMLRIGNNHVIVGVIEKDEKGNVVWEYDGLKFPQFVQRIGNVPLPLKK